MSMSFNETRSLVQGAIKENLVPYISGPPGIGKSTLVKLIKNSSDYWKWVRDLRLPQLEPTDLRGIPVPNRETKRVDWYYPSFWPERDPNTGLCTEGPGIIFFDEIEKAPVAVKNAALQIVLDRRVGDYVLPDDVAMVCAGNREEDGTLSLPLGMALANRMVHYEMRHDLDEWMAWAHENEIVGDIMAFVSFKPDLLYKNTGHNAFPSPRSWAMASKLLNAAGDDEVTIKRQISATVGEAISAEFVAWSKVYRDVNPEEIITKGTLPDLDAKDPSFRYAMTMAVAIYARKKGVTKYEDNIVKFLEAVGSELRVVFFRQQTQQAMIKFSKSGKFANIIDDIMDTFDM